MMQSDMTEVPCNIFKAIRTWSGQLSISAYPYSGLTSFRGQLETLNFQNLHLLDETDSEFRQKNIKHRGTGFSRSSGCCHFYSSIKVHMSNMLFPPPHYVRACIPSIQQLSLKLTEWTYSCVRHKLIELTNYCASSNRCSKSLQIQDGPGTRRERMALGCNVQHGTAWPVG